MNEEEFKKQQRREINRRAYLKRIGGNVKNYSKNSNDDNYINFLEKTKKIEKNEKDLFWSKHQKEKKDKDLFWSKNESESESESESECESESDNIDEERYKIDLNYRLNPDIMRKRDENFDKIREENKQKSLYPEYYDKIKNNSFPYLV